jgi:hypothetical protein
MPQPCRNYRRRARGHKARQDLLLVDLFVRSSVVSSATMAIASLRVPGRRSGQRVVPICTIVVSSPSSLARNLGPSAHGFRFFRSSQILPIRRPLAWMLLARTRLPLHSQATSWCLGKLESAACRRARPWPRGHCHPTCNRLAEALRRRRRRMGACLGWPTWAARPRRSRSSRCLKPCIFSMENR